MSSTELEPGSAVGKAQCGLKWRALTCVCTRCRESQVTLGAGEAEHGGLQLRGGLGRLVLMQSCAGGAAQLGRVLKPGCTLTQVEARSKELQKLGAGAGAWSTLRIWLRP